MTFEGDSSMSLYQTACAALAALFESLPPTLPQKLSTSSLPAWINTEFLQQEGPLSAFNQAMHASFGEKANSIKISECGASTEDRNK